MFFYLIYKSPLWKDKETNARNARVVALGIILYVFLHSYLYSNYSEGKDFIVNNRKYIYYLFVMDVITTLGFLYYGSGNKLDKSDKSVNKLPMDPSMVMANMAEFPMHDTQLVPQQIPQQTPQQAPQPTQQPVPQPTQQSVQQIKQPEQIAKSNPVDESSSSSLSNVSSSSKSSSPFIDRNSIPLYDNDSSDDDFKSADNSLGIPVYNKQNNKQNNNNIPIYNRS